MMVETQSRLQLIGELRRLDLRHCAASARAVESGPPELGDLLDRYSYGELLVIADFLAADTDRLEGSAR